MKRMIWFTVLCFAMLQGAIAQQNNARIIVTSPSMVDDWTFAVEIYGDAQGACTVGLGSPGPYPPFVSASPPQGATCATFWHFHWSVSVVSGYGAHCDIPPGDIFHTYLGIVYRCGGGDWIDSGVSTSLGELSPSCCLSPAPQHCTGIWRPRVDPNCR